MVELDCGCLVLCHLGRWATFSAVPSQWPHESSSTARRTLPVRLPVFQGPGWRGFCPCLGAFHRGAKSPVVLLDRNVNGMVYRDILWDTLVPFARLKFGDDFRYQDDNALHHHCTVVTDYLRQKDVSKWTSLHNPLTAIPSSICGTNWGVQSTTWIIPHIASTNSARPCWVSGPISLWDACSIWWPACPGN